jgi:hypothetical protein
VENGVLVSFSPSVGEVKLKEEWCMKKMICVLAVTACGVVAGESPLKPINDLGYGTLSGRLQSVSMHRDYEGTGDGVNSTLGLLLNYTSPEFYGFDLGLGCNLVGELYGNNNTDLLVNDSIYLLNEAWLGYRILEKTKLTIGRKITNGEVFREDDYRQKARSVEGIQLVAEDLDGFKFTLGHAYRMSNWIQGGDRGEFNNFHDVFGAKDDTAGVTWGEVLFSKVKGLEIALFDAYAYDVANLIGLRAKVDVTETTSLLGYYRHENDTGEFPTRDSDTVGFSVEQKVGPVTLSPGYFGVRGDNLLFQETTTGINHPLGVLMMIYASPFVGESDTLFLKATAKIHTTALYALYNYTWNDNLAYDGQELNLVVKQPIYDQLSLALKTGVGYRSAPNNTFASDIRLFITYLF